MVIQVPLIFPKKKPSLEVLKDKITDPLNYFDHENKPGSIYRRLRERLFELLPNQSLRFDQFVTQLPNPFMRLIQRKLC
jgi:hypothetical protein